MDVSATICICRRVGTPARGLGRCHQPVGDIRFEAAGRASRGRAVAAAPAQRERDDVALLQARLVLRAQADRLAAALDLAISDATRAAARHPVRRAAEAIAVERDRNVVGQDLTTANEPEAATLGTLAATVGTQAVFGDAEEVEILIQRLYRRVGAIRQRP